MYCTLLSRMLPELGSPHFGLSIPFTSFQPLAVPLLSTKHWGEGFIKS